MDELSNMETALLKNPYLVVEGMVQSATDTVDQEGLAFTGGYVAATVATSIATDNIFENMTDDIFRPFIFIFK